MNYSEVENKVIENTIKINEIENKIYKDSHEIYKIENRLDVESLRINSLLTTVPVMKKSFDLNGEFNQYSQKVILQDELEIMEFLIFNKEYTNFIKDYSTYEKFKKYFMLETNELRKQHGGFKNLLKVNTILLTLEGIKRDFIKNNGG